MKNLFLLKLKLIPGCQHLIDNKEKTNNINQFYLKGNVYKDKGSSFIYIYSDHKTKELIYSEKTDKDGYFKIGPFYIFENGNYFSNYVFEVFKVKENSSYIIEADNNYNNYSSTIKLGGYGFDPHYPFPLMTDILLEKKINKNFIVFGYIFNIVNNKSLGYVYVKIYKGSKIIYNKEDIDNNYIATTTSSKDDGYFKINVDSNGQYTLVFYNEEYFIETKNIYINDTNINVNNISLIQLFYSGKIVVKLEWEKNPPDLDLFCRFRIKNEQNNSKINYCYTFFGNQRCVESNYPLDNKKGGDQSCEIIEIETVSDYVYFFYVRKYFDTSNSTAQNEFKINDIDDDLNSGENNIKTYYKDNDELLKNSKAKISIYANGIKTPINIMNIRNEDLDENKYNYWAGFCLNGKEGLQSLKIINKFYKNEPPKNICLY